MNQRALVAVLLGLVTISTACGKKKPVTEATPTQGGGTPTPPPAVGGGTTTNPNTGSTTPTTTPTNASTTEVTASLTQVIHFDLDQFEILAGDRAILDMKIQIMKRNPNVQIRIVGHCDERGSDEYNIALGMKRAQAARDYLVRGGIDGSRIQVASLGRESPVDPASNEGAWAKNRRDEFEITAGGQNLVRP